MNGLMDLGGGVGFGGMLLIGALGGWIAEKLTRSDVGLITNIITGIVGSFIGGYIANTAGINVGEIVPGWFWSNLLVSAVGAVILVAVLKMLRGRRG
jgi:uncharacterized membrane protein YeaQ/YmgE (transglycosylase-associated protein family)